MQFRRHLQYWLGVGFAAVLCGCASWSQLPQDSPLANTSNQQSQLTLPSQQQQPLPMVSETDSFDNDQNPPAHSSETIVRGQDSRGFDSFDSESAGSDDYYRNPMPVSGVPASGNRLDDESVQDSFVEPSQYFGSPDVPQYGDPYGDGAGRGYGTMPPPFTGPTMRPGDIGFGAGPTQSDISQPFTGRYADLEVSARETQTGRFMFGVGVNSDAGLTAQVVIDEYNFDWRRFPRSPRDIIDGTAWRGGGQRLRIEAVPGRHLQRYLVNFTEPYLFDTPISLNLSGYLYDRRYFDWDEQRLGGRVGLGYRITHDLSLAGGIRVEDVEITSPRIRGIPELEQVLGSSTLMSGRVSLTHDTRDSQYAPTEGHMLELSYEQTFGTYDYPRGVVDYRRYFLINQRVDSSGRHVLGTSIRAGFSGDNTPLFENFFAGGYSTIRGFRFRSANPKSGDIYVGGEFSLLGSFEYLFPISADDMLKGVVFCDYGTIEEQIQIEGDDFRVTVGAGLRIFVPAMGPAPIAVDFAIPIAREDTDRIQNFSFFVGFGR